MNNLLGIDKILNGTIYFQTKDNKMGRIDFPNIVDCSVSQDFDKIEVSFLCYKTYEGTLFTMTLEEDEREDKEKMSGSIVYCHIGKENKDSFDLNKEFYVFYIDVPPEQCILSIGTIFKPLTASIIPENWNLRCEAIYGVNNKEDADALEGFSLTQIENIQIIKHSNLYGGKNKIYFDKNKQEYKYNNTIYSQRYFWDNIVEYNESAQFFVTNSADNLYYKNTESERNIINEGVNVMEKKNTFGNMFKNMKFGSINDNTIKYSFKGIAFKTSDGDFVIYNDDFTFINVGDMIIDMPIFAMPVSREQIAVGDVIYHNNTWVIVNEVSDNEIKVAKPWTKEIVTVIPETSIFGFSFYTKVINLFDNLNATADEKNPFGNLLPFLLLNNKEDNINNVMMLAMLNGSIDMKNPFMLYAMMGNNNSELNPLMFLMMSEKQQFKKETPSIYIDTDDIVNRLEELYNKKKQEKN